MVLEIGGSHVDAQIESKDKLEGQDLLDVNAINKFLLSKKDEDQKEDDKYLSSVTKRIDTSKEKNGLEKEKVNVIWARLKQRLEDKLSIVVDSSRFDLVAKNKIKVDKSNKEIEKTDKFNMSKDSITDLKSISDSLRKIMIDLNPTVSKKNANLKKIKTKLLDIQNRGDIIPLDIIAVMQKKINNLTTLDPDNQSEILPFDVKEYLNNDKKYNYSLMAKNDNIDSENLILGKLNNISKKTLKYNNEEFGEKTISELNVLSISINGETDGDTTKYTSNTLGYYINSVKKYNKSDDNKDKISSTILQEISKHKQEINDKIKKAADTLMIQEVKDIEEGAPEYDTSYTNMGNDFLDGITSLNDMPKVTAKKLELNQRKGELQEIKKKIVGEEGKPKYGEMVSNIKKLELKAQKLKEYKNLGCDTTKLDNTIKEAKKKQNDYIDEIESNLSNIDLDIKNIENNPLVIEWKQKQIQKEKNKVNTNLSIRSSFLAKEFNSKLRSIRDIMSNPDVNLIEKYTKAEKFMKTKKYQTPHMITDDDYNKNKNKNRFNGATKDKANAYINGAKSRIEKEKNKIREIIPSLNKEKNYAEIVDGDISDAFYKNFNKHPNAYVGADGNAHFDDGEIKLDKDKTLQDYIKRDFSIMASKYNNATEFKAAIKSPDTAFKGKDKLENKDYETLWNYIKYGSPNGSDKYDYTKGDEGDGRSSEIKQLQGLLNKLDPRLTAKLNENNNAGVDGLYGFATINAFRSLSGVLDNVTNEVEYFAQFNEVHIFQDISGSMESMTSIVNANIELYNNGSTKTKNESSNTKYGRNGIERGLDIVIQYIKDNKSALESTKDTSKKLFRLYTDEKDQSNQDSIAELNKLLKSIGGKCDIVAVQHSDGGDIVSANAKVVSLDMMVNNEFIKRKVTSKEGENTERLYSKVSSIKGIPSFKLKESPKTGLISKDGSEFISAIVNFSPLKMLKYNNIIDRKLKMFGIPKSDIIYLQEHMSSYKKETNEKKKQTLVSEFWDKYDSVLDRIHTIDE